MLSYLLEIFIPIILLTIIILTILRVQVEIKIIIKNGSNFSFIILRLFKGLLRLRINLSIMSGKKGLLSVFMRKTDSKLEHQTPINISYLLHLSGFYSRYKNQLAYMMSKIKFRNFSVLTRVGVGDAAATALVTGGFFTIFSLIITHLENRYDLQKKKIVILPFFQGSVFDIDLDCIIDFKMGHIIITGLKILMKKLKVVKNHG